VTVDASQSEVVANAQRIVISVRPSGTTETIVQIGVPATTADYGVLIPTPTEPTLDSMPISAEALDNLEASSRPKIVKEYTSADSDSGSGCGCLPIAGGDDSSSGAPGTGQPVTASQPTNIGPVTAVTLTATDATALNDWLDANGFAIPDERQDLLANYVGPGRYFIAVKRNDATADGGATSIGLHYTLQGDHRLLSLAFARLGAAPTVAFTVFLFGTRGFPSPPFQTLTLNDLDAKLLAKDDYEGAVQAAVKAHGSKAFVIEAAATPPSTTAYLPTSVVDPNSGFFRMTTVLAADDLTEDATFFAPNGVTVPTSRTIEVSGGAPVPASAGVFGLVALAWRARRRRTRRSS
jgi:hypothetical protein